MLEVRLNDTGLVTGLQKAQQATAASLQQVEQQANRSAAKIVDSLSQAFKDSFDKATKATGLFVAEQRAGLATTAQVKAALDAETRARQEQIKSLQRGTAEYALTVDRLGELRQSLRQTTTELARLENTAKGTGARLSDAFRRGVADGPRELENITQRLGTSLGAIITPAGLAATAIAGVGAATVSLARLGLVETGRFEAAMNTLAASGEKDLGALEQSLRDLQKEGGNAALAFSQSELAGALADTVKAGVSASDALGLLATGTQLAAAEGQDLTQSTGLVLKNLRQFGLDATEAARAGDALASAGLLAAGTAADLSEGLAKVGPVAKAAGFSLEETLGALVNLDNKGLSAASIGADAFRTVLASLADPAEKGKETLAALGVSLTRADGSARSAKDILEQLKAAISGNADAMQIAARIFDVQGVTAILALDSTTAEYTTKIKDGTGALGDYADRMTVGVVPAAKRLENAQADLARELSKTLTPAIASVTEELARAIRSFNDFVQTIGGGAAKDTVLSGLESAAKRAGDRVEQLRGQIGRALSPEQAKFLYGANMDLATTQYRQALFALNQYRLGLVKTTESQGDLNKETGKPGALGSPGRAQAVKLEEFALVDYKKSLDGLTVAQLQGAAAAARAAGDFQRFNLIQGELNSRVKATAKDYKEAAKALDQFADDKYRRSLEGLSDAQLQTAVSAAKAAGDFGRYSVTMGEVEKRANKSEAALKQWQGVLGNIEKAKYQDGLSLYSNAQLDAAEANARTAKNADKLNVVLAEQKRRFNEAADAADDYATRTTLPGRGEGDNIGNVVRGGIAQGRARTKAEQEAERERALERETTRSMADRLEYQRSRLESIARDLSEDLRGRASGQESLQANRREEINAAERALNPTAEFDPATRANVDPRLVPELLKALDEETRNRAVAAGIAAEAALAAKQEKADDAIIAGSPGGTPIDLENRRFLDPRMIPPEIAELDQQARDAAVATGLAAEALEKAAISAAEALAEVLRFKGDGDTRGQESGPQVGRDADAVRRVAGMTDITGKSLLELRDNLLELEVIANDPDRFGIVAARDARDLAGAYGTTIKAQEDLIAAQAKAGQLDDPRGASDAAAVARGQKVTDAIGLQPDTLKESADKLELINRLLADPAYDEHREFLLQARVDSQAWNAELGGIVDSVTLLGRTVGAIDLSPLDPTPFLNAARSAFQAGVISLEDYATELQVNIEYYEEFGQGTLEARTEIARLKKELESVTSPLGQITQGLGIASGLFRQLGGSAGNALANLADFGKGILDSLKNPLELGGKILSAIIDLFTVGAREAEEFRKQVEGIQKSFSLIDTSKLIKTRTVAGGFFGLGTKQEVDQEASALGLTIAQTLEQGVLSGFTNGIKAAIKSGDFGEFQAVFKAGIGNAILDALLETFVQSGILKGVLGPALTALSAAFLTEDTADDDAALALLDKALPAALEKAEGFYSRLGDIASKYGLTDSPEASGSIRKPTTPLGLDLSPNVQSIIATPLLDSANVYSAASAVFRVAVDKFDAVISRLERTSTTLAPRAV